MSVVQGVYDAIIDEPTFTAKLAEYNGSPAVFTMTPAPEDCEHPLVTISQVSGSLGNGRDRGHRGGEFLIDVNVWGDKGDSEKAIREYADELWLLLDRASVQADGFDETVYCVATPPSRVSDPDGFPGFLITCRVLVRTA